MIVYRSDLLSKVHIANRGRHHFVMRLVSKKLIVNSDFATEDPSIMKTETQKQNKTKYFGFISLRLSTKFHTLTYNSVRLQLGCLIGRS